MRGLGKAFPIGGALSLRRDLLLAVERVEGTGSAVGVGEDVDAGRGDAEGPRLAVVRVRGQDRRRDRTGRPWI